MPKGIYKHILSSKQREVLKRMSDGHIGKKGYWYGKKHTEEQKKKTSNSMKGKNTWTKGTHRTEEWKQKMKGKVSPMKGKHHTLESREKIREALTGRKISPEVVLKQQASKKGYRHSEETRNKIGIGNTKPKTKKNCIICDKLFSVPPWELKRKYCSGKCYFFSRRESFSKENNPRWIKNRTIILENHRIRDSFEMKLWRKSCFERDNFTDQKTGQRGGRLVVHHINNFADFPELRTSIENGITLSKESHKLFHHIYGNRNNTKEQMEEFLVEVIPDKE